jgi:hypothetical protein
MGNIVASITHRLGYLPTKFLIEVLGLLGKLIRLSIVIYEGKQIPYHQPLSCYNTSYIDERSELSLEDSSTVAKLYF